jgi:styrene monooxygenase
MTKKVGIIGAGTAGLQLGLHLLENGIETTIFTDRRPQR